MRSRLLWSLAAVLGIATMVVAASMIHDLDRHRAAARTILLTEADHVIALADTRLDASALAALSPDATPETMWRAQRVAAACACRDTLPVSAFFAFDAAHDAMRVRTAAGDVPAPAPLAELARSEARRARETHGPTLHVALDPRLGDDALVTWTQFDAAGAAAQVVGLVTDRRALGAALFAAAFERATFVDSAAPLVALDSLSLRVDGPDGRALFGQVPEWRSMRATVHPRGALDGLAVHVALRQSQIALPLAGIVSPTQLWWLGVLALAAALLIALAGRASRRETALERARADFVAGVSHDLRMPLAQILLAGETLSLGRARDEGDRSRLAGSVVRESRRVIAIVENILLYARAGADALRPTLGQVDVDAVLADVAESTGLDAPTSGLRVRAEPVLLRQALVNLAENALKYATPGQRVALGAERVGLRVRLLVDGGRAIPEAERERLFRPYERLARDRAGEQGGAGLGLAVVRQIADALGARVWLEDAPEGGTRAVFEVVGWN